MRNHRNLSNQVALAQVAVLVVVLAAAFAITAKQFERMVEQQYEKRALAVASSVAAMPQIAEQVTGLPPGGPVQSEASAVMAQTGAAYVVVTNDAGIRYSHPDPRLIGRSVVYDDPEPVSSEPFRTGRPWTGVQEGTLGFTARGKAPILVGHRVVGEVSVGFPVEDITDRFLHALPWLAGFVIAALAFGVGAAVLVARRLKRQTLGLELQDITALVQEREALLHGIRDGVIGYDNKGRVLFANDSARDLLDLPPTFLGCPAVDLLPPGRFADAVTGVLPGSNITVVHGDRIVVVNRRPLRVDHRRQAGWVITLQDRTESETLLRELERVTGLTDTLRAQAHEFANQMHTFVGLVELGEHAEAVRYATDLSTYRHQEADRLLEQLGDTRLVALLMAKTALAEERGIGLHLTADSRIDGGCSQIGDVLTVVGNLVDNAIEASAGAPHAGVEVRLVSAGDSLTVTVRDSGPGVPADLREKVFEEGFTTKADRGGPGRGIGLAIIRQLAERRGGRVEAGDGPGGAFTAILPGCVGPAGGAATAGAAGAGAGGLAVGAAGGPGEEGR
ncbi:MAG TPA: sensor histidine kinase [Acidimicrobiales bacterium]|nr:sensor histidine kinase [Acidimicrobiales bacterium]